MSWEMLTALSTFTYVILFFFALRFAYIQTKGFEKNRKLQEAITAFKELQAQDLLNARRYIYESLPENIEGSGNNQLKAHIQKAETALIAYDRIGYLLQQGHIDSMPIMENYWSSIWRCWKKSKNLINWAREQRDEKNYFDKFEHLFNLSESYRIQNGYEEPKLY